MTQKSIVPIVVALITAVGGIVAVRAVPKAPSSVAPLPTSSIELSEGSTAEGSNIINGDAEIIMSPRPRTRKNNPLRQAPFSTTQLSPWATLDDLPAPQVSALVKFRGDSQGIMAANQELWLYVLPHGITPPDETKYVLSPVRVNENNGRWLAVDVVIGQEKQALGQRFEVGLLIAPTEAVQQRTFKLGELPGTVQTSRNFVMR